MQKQSEPLRARSPPFPTTGIGVEIKHPPIFHVCEDFAHVRQGVIIIIIIIIIISSSIIIIIIKALDGGFFDPKFKASGIAYYSSQSDAGASRT
eukprot:SAG31_NODE_75_length_27561_cov_28.859333_2_plen_94_part_00